jgi:hypothetical protein
LPSVPFTETLQINDPTINDFFIVPSITDPSTGANGSFSWDTNTVLPLVQPGQGGGGVALGLLQSAEIDSVAFELWVIATWVNSNGEATYISPDCITLLADLTLDGNAILSASLQQGDIGYYSNTAAPGQCFVSQYRGISQPPNPINLTPSSKLGIRFGAQIPLPVPLQNNVTWGTRSGFNLIVLDGTTTNALYQTAPIATSRVVLSGQITNQVIPV